MRCFRLFTRCAVSPFYWVRCCPLFAVVLFLSRNSKGAPPRYKYISCLLESVCCYKLCRVPLPVSPHPPSPPPPPSPSPHPNSEHLHHRPRLISRLPPAPTNTPSLSPSCVRAGGDAASEEDCDETITDPPAQAPAAAAAADDTPTFADEVSGQVRRSEEEGDIRRRRGRGGEEG